MTIDNVLISTEKYITETHNIIFLITDLNFCFELSVMLPFIIGCCWTSRGSMYESIFIEF